jgi:hypothetical protein
MRYVDFVGFCASILLLATLLWLRASTPQGLPGYMIVGGVVSFFYVIWASNNLMKRFSNKT